MAKFFLTVTVILSLSISWSLSAPARSGVEEIDDGSLHILKGLFNQYSDKLESAMNLVNMNKFQEANLELGALKDILSGILSVFQAKSALSQLPIVGQLQSHISELSKLGDQINIELDTGDNKIINGMVDKLKSTFSILSQVKDSVSSKVDEVGSSVSSKGLKGLGTDRR